MKALSRLLLIGVILAAMIVPFTAISGELAAPLVTSVSPGQTTLHYAGQDLRFTTDVALKIELSAPEPGKIRLTVMARGVPPGSSSANTQIQIYWENWDNEIYEGPPPVGEPWSGILLTESGFTEK
jgi:hypothetical protein